MRTNVLFLCTGNSARSQMAEAFLRGLGGDQFRAFSAGLEPKGLPPLSVQVMAEIGYDLSGHRSKGVDEFLGEQLFRYISPSADLQRRILSGAALLVRSDSLPKEQAGEILTKR
ncbi:MAG: arsenate reductase ArsC [Anaerolineales bacterium]